MSATIEKLANNEIKITFTISPERFEEGMQHAYNVNKNKLNVPGFRKGKVPKKMAEKIYGKGYFYEDAINFVLPDAYEAAIDEYNLEPVSRPSIDIEDIETPEGAIITAHIVVKPEVKLGNYIGLTYKKPDLTVTDEEMDEELKRLAEQNSRIVTVTDRSIEPSDIAVIDFEGFIDGVPFEGGKSEDHELVIGSNTFIGDFENQLVGLNVGDTKDVTVTFPDDYHSAELAGKPAVFKVTVKDIKIRELPVIDDELAQDVSEFDTLEEYKNDFKARIQESKLRDANHEKEEALVSALIASSEIDLPECMVESECNMMLRDFEYRIKSQGMNLDMYMQYTGTTIEQINEVNAKTARQRVLGRLVLEAVAKEENFTISDEELDAAISDLATEYKMEKEKLMSVFRDEDRRGLTKDLLVKKALEKIAENAIEID